VKDLEEHFHKTISNQAFHQYDQLQQDIATNALSLNQGQWILGGHWIIKGAGVVL
jgi:hypothetical protein